MVIKPFIHFAILSLYSNKVYMSKFYSFFLFILFIFSANAQDEFTLKGTVLDVNTQIPLESATVYFSNVKDSTVLEYTTTDKNGFFKINTNLDVKKKRCLSKDNVFLWSRRESNSRPNKPSKSFLHV